MRAVAVALFAGAAALIFRAGYVRGCEDVALRLTSEWVAAWTRREGR